MRIDEERADRRKQDQRNQLARRQHVRDRRTRPDAGDVDDRQELTTRTITAARQPSLSAPGTKNARYVTKRFVNDAKPAMRAIHINQPT